MARTKAEGGTGSLRKFRFTRESLDAVTCPPGKSQALYWDTDEPGLGLRVTSNGARSFIFESKLGRQTVRVTIGPASMPIRAAKDKMGKPVTTGANTEAARLAGLFSQGIDPRVEKAAIIAKQAEERGAAKVERQRLEVTALQAWDDYCEERRPRWSERHHADHLSFASAGGAKRKRAKVLTEPGPLRALLVQPLAQIDPVAVHTWLTREVRNRPARARLGFALLRAFLNWCAENPVYERIVNADVCKSKRLREKLGKPARKGDSLQQEQLAVWFSEVRRSGNPLTAAYLQALLLTGARREELLSLQWADVDFRWKSMRIKDKVSGERIIPLTPYVAQILGFLPRREGNPWVFSSTAAKNGRLQDPRIHHNRALAAAGLPHITLHGLRRSFGTLSEWVECPVGVVAQIQGHKPSATAEKHYRVRPLDLLRMWHVRIEGWILGKAGIQQPAEDEKPAGLRIVSAAA